MFQVRPLLDFFTGIENDGRIGPTHIALFSAVMTLYVSSGYENPVQVYRSRLMVMAKILGQATFHKVIKDLDECGYIVYQPRRDRKASKIFLKIKETVDGAERKQEWKPAGYAR